MHILFNGQRILIQQPQPLTKILKSHSIESQTPGIAVAVNAQIIPRDKWDSQMIVEDDEVDVVHAVQGG
jgi:sulfur carrier protein